LELARTFDRPPGLPSLVESNHHQEGHEMSQININRVVITGNLTADPDLRTLQSGTSVCKLRVACNTRRKDSTSDKWVDKPNYFDVTVWGSLGETVAKYTAKGRPVAIDGRLEWREWDTDNGAKRQAIEIIADSVQFLSSPTANGTTEHEA
jgi:single-strand DNA-binding protein